jgi:hypothetical protein
MLYFARDHVANGELVLFVLLVGGQYVGLFDRGPAKAFVAG